MRFVASGFFHESVSPQPQSNPLGLFQIFSKFAKIFTSQGAPPVSTRPAAKLPPLSTTLATVSPVLLIPSANCHWCQRRGVNNTGGKQWDQ